MALSELGFDRPFFEDILEAQINRAKELFGEDIDTSELSALGKYIRINVADIDTLYQILEGVYYARFPNTATGLSLDRLCPFAGITRNLATSARYSVLFTGTANETIEAGFEVSNETQSVIFHTMDDYKIGSDGTVVAEVECNDTGEDGNIEASAINTIVNPVAEVSLVSGIKRLSDGEETETDQSLRERFKDAIAGTGSGTAEAIKGAVMRVSGVDDCTIVEDLENNTFTCIVSYDGSETTTQLIGQAIFEKKPIGVKAVGDINVYVTVEGEDSEPHLVSFNATTKKNITIKFTLKTNNYFEENGAEQIKKNITNYLADFSNGETLYLSALYSFINIIGVVSVSGLVAVKDGVTYTDKVDFGEREVARISESDITIEFVDND